jgi:uncharacterized protein
MLGARRLEQLLNALRGVLPDEYPIGIQTNGILITPEILSICENTRVTLSVSIDGPPDVHDRFRIGKKGEGTHAQTLAGISLLRQHPNSSQLFTGVLVVVNPFSDPKRIYDYLKQLEVPSADFLYRDGNHTKLPFGKSSNSSTEYGTWLIKILDLYLVDTHPPRIRILDDLIKLSMGGKGSKEGIGDDNYGIIIIDTDGSISKNDTLKSTKPGADLFEHSWTVHTHSLTSILKTPEFKRYYTLQQPTASKCKACSELKVCGGGMPLHRWSDENGLDNPSVYCSDQLLLISAIRQRLEAAGFAA